MQEKNRGSGGVWVGGSGLVGRSGRISEVFLKIQKKIGGGGGVESKGGEGRGIRVELNEELKCW